MRMDRHIPQTIYDPRKQQTGANRRSQSRDYTVKEAVEQRSLTILSINIFIERMKFVVEALCLLDDPLLRSLRWFIHILALRSR